MFRIAPGSVQFRRQRSARASAIWLPPARRRKTVLGSSDIVPCGRISSRRILGSRACRLPLIGHRAAPRLVATAIAGLLLAACGSGHRNATVTTESTAETPVTSSTTPASTSPNPYAVAGCRLWSIGVGPELLRYAEAQNSVAVLRIRFDLDPATGAPNPATPWDNLGNDAVYGGPLLELPFLQTAIGYSPPIGDMPDVIADTEQITTGCKSV